jgi:hypothetical protein
MPLPVGFHQLAAEHEGDVEEGERREHEVAGEPVVALHLDALAGGDAPAEHVEEGERRRRSPAPPACTPMRNRGAGPGATLAGVGARPQVRS